MYCFQFLFTLQALSQPLGDLWPRCTSCRVSVIQTKPSLIWQRVRFWRTLYEKPVLTPRTQVPLKPSWIVGQIPGCRPPWLAPSELLYCRHSQRWLFALISCQYAESDHKIFLSCYSFASKQNMIIDIYC